MIVACLKWVDQRPELDAHGAVEPPDARFAGVSAADRAALEWALRSRDVGGGEVVAVSVGPAPADAVLHDAVGAGADRAVRIDVPFGESSASVAAAIALVAAGAQQIWCGDYSSDRGTGSVPAFLAAELGIVQALGLVRVSFGDDGSIDALRRLDGGRRERLSINAPAVLSVEGSTAMLRRAPLRALLVPAVIEVREASAASSPSSTGMYHPFRPRPRALAAPAGASALQRVKVLTGMTGPGAASSSARAEPVALDPVAAADRILGALREWGYLPADHDQEG